ncbi:MAG: glycerol-3-phosphate 1-O-acyltransferase PlsY [Chitinophagaceae bacterium]|nr:glycerol-3-phosphate 1-O-acyltransferase PlsY [Chitinophagaceae bacterium]
MNALLLMIAAYLLGSIPTALWVSKLFFGIDIREHGSKNMGASNTFRVLGAGWGIFVLIVDMAKAMAAVQLAKYVHADDWLGSEKIFWQVMMGLAAVAGHIFPLFAGFRGGKGVACLFGMVLAIQPWTAVISVIAFLAVVIITRYISLGSLIAVIVFAGCVLFAVKEENLYFKGFAIVSAVLVFVLHASNIRRLIKGTENKISFKKKKKDK